jgi:hypothetical protein
MDIVLLDKYQAIPPLIRNKVTSPQKIEEVKALVTKYGIDVVDLVTRILVKDLQLNRLVDYLVNDLSMSKTQAEALQVDLSTKIFVDLQDYLGMVIDKTATAVDTNSQSATMQSNQPSQSTILKSAKPIPALHQEVMLNAMPKSEQPKPLEQTENQHAVPEHIEEIEARIEKLIKKANINFSSQIMATRFHQILRIYLKGVRNRLDTKASILKPFDIGGLGLDEKSAENILSILNDEQKFGQTKIKPLARIKVPEDRKELISRSTEYNLADSVKDKPILTKTESTINSGIRNDPASIITSHELMERPIELTAGKSAKPADMIIKHVPQPQVNLPRRQPISKIVRTGNGKIRMDDVRSMPKVLSPVDELRYMNLRSWRNLNPDPHRRTEIILEKLELFRKEDYTKRVAGVSAWRLSPVNQVYVSILKSSIANGQEVGKVMAAQLKQNPEFMTQEEFNEIVKLNRQLEY